MASTLIKRICDPNQLTDAEELAVRTELGLSEDEPVKLRINAVIGVLSELEQGRQDSSVMDSFLTAAEQVDAQAVVDAVGLNTFTIQEVWLLMHLGETQFYTPTQIESILSL